MYVKLHSQCPPLAASEDSDSDGRGSGGASVVRFTPRIVFSLYELPYWYGAENANGTPGTQNKNLYTLDFMLVVYF